MLIIFSAALLLSAILFFWVQPMFAKMVLPMLGGTPAVWNTCMVFYQAVLLAGYVYAHLGAKWLGERKQAVLHLVLLAVAVIYLPAALREGWVPPVEKNFISWLFMVLVVSIGLPVFAISATAPMLQKWFSHTAHPSARDPYFLYAASNAGSMLALIGYPLVIEPNLRLGQQAWAWTAGYGLLAFLIAGCAYILWKSVTAPGTPAKVAEGPRREQGFGGSHEALDVRQRIWWLLLTFAPSSMLLGVTTYITTDIAAVPLLWVLPLAIYLLTFVLVFSRRPPLSHDRMVRAQPLLIIPIAILFLEGSNLSKLATFPLHLLAFFVTAMVCHGELVKRRPPASHLTEFYIWVSVGGMLGGMFNALLAPFVFDSIAEYPIAIALACMLRPGRNPGLNPTRARVLDLLVPLTLLVLLVVLGYAIRESLPKTWLLAFIPSALAAGAVSLRVSSRPLRFGLCVGAIVLAGFWGLKSQSIHAERNFFGVLRIWHSTDDKFISLYHGTTIHGARSNDPALRSEPLTYYTRSGPLGEVFKLASESRKTGKVAVMGLGTGSLASYAAPGEHWTFYEIDPAVERIARDTRYFTFLDDALAEVDVLLGDARLKMASAPEGSFGMIVLDAFNSDSIPVHLVTREALQMYLTKLSEGGMLVFHISNRYLDLKPVLGNLARDAGLYVISKEVTSPRENMMKFIFGSTWVVMARSAEDLGALVDDPQWVRLTGSAGARPWTDDFSNIVSVLK